MKTDCRAPNYRAVTSNEPLCLARNQSELRRFPLFLITNGDFAYQAGEPAARIDDPVINWFSDMPGQDRVDYAALQIEEIMLAKTTILERKLDFSLTELRKDSRVSDNFLRIVSWDDEMFSVENAKRGLWEPIWFQEEIGYGLYVLEEFDPTKKSILLVHGITDTPRVLRDAGRCNSCRLPAAGVFTIQVDFRLSTPHIFSTMRLMS